MYQFFTPTKISANRAKTRSGYLIIRDVPVARTGAMLYMPGEVPVQPDRGNPVVVERDATDLFTQDTMSSFSGVPVTLGHPSKFVTASTHKNHARGYAMHPRQGEGDFADHLIMDLVVTDPELIQMIDHKQIAEISAGYDARYSTIKPGHGRQHTIIGNHVAFVPKGRCGASCSVGDERPNDMSSRKTPPGAEVASINKLKGAYFSQNEEEFAAALEEILGTRAHATADGASAAGEPTSLTINIGADGSVGARTRDSDSGTDTDDKATTDAIGKLQKTIDDWSVSFNRRLDKIEADMALGNGITKTKDAAPGTDKGREGQPGTQTMDAAGYGAAWSETMSLAEILAPGMHMPTFDAATPAGKMQDNLCEFRRKALQRALSDEATAETIKGVVGNTNIDYGTCDSISPVFKASAELMRMANKNRGFSAGTAPKVVGTVTFGKPFTPPTPAEMNRRAREKYGKQDAT